MHKRNGENQSCYDIFMIESIEGGQDNSSNAGENPWQKMANEVLQQPQEESFPTHNESFEMVRGNFQKNYNAKVESLQKLKEQLATTDENDSRMVNYLTRRIDSEMSTVRYLGSVLKRMRPNDEEDLKKRSEILGKFSKAVDEVIPDGEPIVFHGVNNIETIKTIIESGGLKTPEERGAGYKSFASQIDVTAKKNIRTSCNFADAGAQSFFAVWWDVRFLSKRV